MEATDEVVVGGVEVVVDDVVEVGRVGLPVLLFQLEILVLERLVNLMQLLKLLGALLS